MGGKKRYGGVLAAIVLVLFAVGCGKNMETETASSADEPITITFWHYYNDAQKDGLDAIIAEYNATAGKEKHVTVEGAGLGSVDDITTKVESVLNGSEKELKRPNMFLAYRDMLQEIRGGSPDVLLDFRDYFTEEELGDYYPDFLEEGEFGEALYIMPVTKSTELLFMNQTMLDLFFQENPDYSVADLETWESIAVLAQAFYQWTDAVTPDAAGDGKAFVGLDNYTNYFIAQNVAMGSDIYEIAEDGSVSFHLEKAYIDRLFLNYYIPYTKGYYGGDDKYCSDGVRQDELCGYIGSVSSVAYFPRSAYGEDGGETAIEMGIYPYPCFDGEGRAAIQQGAGIAALDASARENQAVADFVKWLSQEKGIAYSSMVSYMPTSAASVEEGNLDAIEDENLRNAVRTGLEQVKNYRMARGFDFEGAYGVRAELEAFFKSFLDEGRATYLEYLEKGMTPEEAEEAMRYEEQADIFYGRISEILS